MKKLSGKITKILLLAMVAVCFVSTGIVTAEETEVRPLTDAEIAERKAQEPALMPAVKIEEFDVRLQDSSESAGYYAVRGVTDTKYDSREQAYWNKVAVGDQSTSGLCWAFTASTVAEIAYYHENMDVNVSNINLSPKRFGYFFYNRVNDPLSNTGSDKNTLLGSGKNYVNRGGNNQFTMLALANWGGLALQLDSEPFNVDAAQSFSTDTAYNNQLVLENAEILDNTAEVKQAIKDHGAVMASMWYEDQYLSSSTADAYLCNVSKNNNHAITIIGWDDEFPAANFVSTSGVTTTNKGAWIAQNSWGTNWGSNGGYFYISYDDPSLTNFVSLDMQTADTYDYNYQYDGNAFPSDTVFYISGSTSQEYQSAGDMMANVYTVEGTAEAQQLDAVGFASWDANGADYIIEVYTNVGSTPVSGTKQCTQEVTVNNRGFHTFTLDDPVQMMPGVKYSIVVRAKNDGAVFCYEEAWSNDWISFSCGTAAGQSYIKLAQSSSWHDLNQEGMTARIKGYTSIVEGGSTEQPIIPTDPETAADRVFKGSKSARYGGDDRYETALKIANAYKIANNISKFDAVIVACGSNYPDALAGSYLAEVKNAPILLVGANTSSEAKIRNYIKENLKSKGQVYLLGGTAVVSSRFETSLKNAGYKVTRLGGSTRYDTNLKILKAAGVTNQDILICTGSGYADSLSASAVGKPIMIVGNKLTNQQKSYLAGLSGDRFYLIGGSSVVSNTVSGQLKSYGSVSRVWGATRYETSAAVAKKFFKAGDTDAAVLAYAQNFPDGLSGGPLALSLDGPLILTNNSSASVARRCVRDLGIKHVAVLGGSGLISNGTVNYILN